MMPAFTSSDSPKGAGSLLAGAALFSVAVNLLYFAVPLFFLQVFDRVLSSRSFETLTALCAIVALSLLSLALLESARAVLSRRIGERLELRFARSALINAFRTGVAGGKPLGRATGDLDRVVRYFGRSGLVAALDLPWSIVFSAVLFLIHPWLGLVALSGVIVLAALSMVAARLPRSLVSAIKDSEGEAASFSQVWNGNERVAAALGTVPHVAARWQAARRDRTRAQTKLLDRQANAAAAAKAIRLLVLCATVAVGAILVIHGSLSGGTLFAASLLAGRAVTPIEPGIAALAELRQVRAAWKRLAETVREPQAASSLARRYDRSRGLEIQHLAFRAAGGSAGVAGISFSLAPGSVLGVVGPCASGKSLLLKVIVGVLRPHAGYVRLGGVEIAGEPLPSSPSRVGYLPQGGGPLEGTIASIIGRGDDTASDVVLAAADMAGLPYYVENLPEGFGTRLPAADPPLPMGLLQQIALARALYGPPDLVVLDEPTTHLDSDGERALLDAINRLRSAGTTVVVASHRPSVLGLADNLLVLRDGRTEMLGPRNSVLRALAETRSTPLPGPTSHHAGVLA